jgi:hypothetical protein
MKDYQVELASERRTILQFRVRAKTKSEAQVIAMKKAKEFGHKGYTVTKVTEI